MKARLFGMIVSLLVIPLFCLPQTTVHADIGVAPIYPSGSSLQPPEGIQTNVRMVAEEVNLTVEPLDPSSPPVNGYHMHARVEAEFLMRNLGESDEVMDVWFPLAVSLRDSALLDLFPENVIRDFKVWADQQPLQVTQVNEPDLSDPSRKSPWACFPITFPTGQDVTVRVTYTLYPSGRGIFGSYEYILQTGAGWRDTIGKAAITVHLPYPVTIETVSQSQKSVEGYPLEPQPSGYTIENDLIRWEFTNLEPTPQDDIFVDVLEPNNYQRLVQARKQATSQPDSVEAQLGLARATKGALVVIKTVWGNGGGPDLAKQVNVAYRRALQLAPAQASIYAEYADWLLYSGGWVSLFSDGTCPAELCDLVARGLTISPENGDLLKIDEQIRAMQADAAYSRQAAIDQTATASASIQDATPEAADTAIVEVSQPTATTIPTQFPTEIPAVTITPQPTAQPPQRSNPIPWLVPLIVVGGTFMALLVWQSRRK